MAASKQAITRLDPSREFKAFVERVKADGLHASPAQIRKLNSKLKEMTTFQPKVGVLGKTGAGKSSLCNALFGRRTAKVSNVKACTRAPQEVLVNLTPEGAGMTLVDVPGVGESEKRDVEYQELYEKLLPELDLVLWVLKGDDRAFSIDERFYREVVLPSIGNSDVKIVFVINQVDKIAPSREWNWDDHAPGPKQTLNIAAKVADVRRVFKLKAKSPVVAVSADEHYGLVDLVNNILLSLPDEKKYGFAREVPDENVSAKTEATVKRGFWNSIKRVAKEIFVEAAPELIESGVKWVIKNLPILLKIPR